MNAEHCRRCNTACNNAAWRKRQNKAVQNDNEPEIALEMAVNVFLTDCKYNEASDSAKNFLGLDNEKRYYSI